MIFHLLKNVVQKLEDLEIPYMLSGSVALIVYTTPRMTRDIDFVVHLLPKDITNFVNIFKNGFYCDQESIEEEVLRHGMFNLIDNETGYKIDFIVRKKDEFRIVEFERRQKTDVFGLEIWIVSIEDLIISKLIWIQELQSDKQKEDINNLLENSELDKNYLYFWVKKLKLQTFNLL